MTETTESAVTAAELDDGISDRVTVTRAYWTAIHEKLAVLRRERDEARAHRDALLKDADRDTSDIAELSALCAKKDAALRRIDSINDNPAIFNAEIDRLIQACLTPASEEAPASPAAGLEKQCRHGVPEGRCVVCPRPAPASPAEAEMRRALDRMAAGDCEEVDLASPSPGLVCVWKCPTPEWCGEHGCDVKAKNEQKHAASPSPGLRVCQLHEDDCCGADGPDCPYDANELALMDRHGRLRDAVIEECAKVADRGGYSIVIARNIRALASRPVSEREGQQ